LRRADLPSKESYRLCLRVIISELVNSEWEQARKPNSLREKKKKKKKKEEEKKKKKKKEEEEEENPTS
jgi:hypothetical protein